ncbi:MAG: competence protein TfoX [Sphingobacteriia bacterium]|nr:competence protein TfoX [Sphingobacteriia bacterium]
MKKLSHLPNIDSDLESKLVSVGINNPEMLRERGSRNSFMRLKMVYSDACFKMLVRLEGAVQGKLTEDLDEAACLELQQFMEIFNR